MERKNVDKDNDLNLHVTLQFVQCLVDNPCPSKTRQWKQKISFFERKERDLQN